MIKGYISAAESDGGTATLETATEEKFVGFMKA